MPDSANGPVSGRDRRVRRVAQTMRFRAGYPARRDAYDNAAASSRLVSPTAYSPSSSLLRMMEQPFALVRSLIQNPDSPDIPSRGPRPLSWRERIAVGLRYLIITAVLVAAVGAGGWWLSWPLITSTVGPTAYVFATHPRSESARFRNATIGHGVGIGVGIAALEAFGLLHASSVSTIGAPTLRQLGAAAAAVGVTVFVLELLGSHHAPAAATTLLVSTGLAKPGAPLIGLVLGLAIVVAFGPLCGQWRFAREIAAREQIAITPGNTR